MRMRHARQRILFHSSKTLDASANEGAKTDIASFHSLTFLFLRSLLFPWQRSRLIVTKSPKTLRKIDGHGPAKSKEEDKNAIRCKNPICPSISIRKTLRSNMSLNHFEYSVIMVIKVETK